MSDHAMRDHARRLTAAIADTLVSGGQPPASVEVRPPFPPRFGHDERFWAAGPFRLLEYGALGDGSYEYSSFVAGGLSPLGLLAFAGTAGLSAANKRRARREAERAAIPHWHDIDAGTVAVSRYGMYLHTVNGVFPWAWAALTYADLVAPGVMQFSGQSDNGPVSWQIVSDWADLAFLTWAITCHPRHPRLMTDHRPSYTRATVVGPDPERRALPPGSPPPP